MTITADQLANGLSSYLESEVVPLYSGGKQIAIATATIYARKKADTILAAIVGSQLLESLGLVNNQGSIDAGELRLLFDALAESMNIHAGGKLEIDVWPFSGLAFNASDLQKLYSYIVPAGAARPAAVPVVTSGAPVAEVPK
jgi:hypothetical protein